MQISESFKAHFSLTYEKGRTGSSIQIRISVYKQFVAKNLQIHAVLFEFLVLLNK